MNNLEKSTTLFTAIKELVIQAQKIAWRNNNSILLNTYWQIGQLIVEDEQKGNTRAAYGKEILKNLSKQLMLEFGSGFDFTNLTNMRKFYLAFPILDAARQELSWTHYRIISRIKDESLRIQYMNHAAEGNWNTRILQRNIDSMYLNRVIESTKAIEQKLEPQNVLKDPLYIRVFRISWKYFG